MNIETVIVGLFGVLIGLVLFLIDAPLTARDIKEKSYGQSDVKVKMSKWLLVILGTFLIFYGLVHE